MVCAIWKPTSNEPRLFDGANSAMNIGATTIDVPMHNPMHVRMGSSHQIPTGIALSSANTPNPRAISSIIFLRPMVSANRPPTMAPTMLPNTVTLVTAPCIDADKWNCLVRKGNAPLIEPLSYP